MTIHKFVTLTREEIKNRMMFDKKDDIRMFKSICEEILNETCKWEYETSLDDEYFTTSCGEAEIFNEGLIKENSYKYCPFCGKTIEEIEP